MTEHGLHFAIIGAGRIARTWAEALPASGVAEVRAIADVDLDAAAGLAARLGCRAFDSHRSLLRGVRVDAAIVCTPPSSHAEIVCELAAAGVHVLCEKPFALHPNDAAAMVSAARAAGALVAMTTKFRFVDGVIAARRLLDDGVLGEIERVEIDFNSHAEMGGTWYADASLSGGGVLMDNGPHAADLTRALLGPLAAVRASEAARPQRLPVEETVQLSVRNRNGAEAGAYLSWSDGTPRADFLVLHGSRGTVRVGWKETRFAADGRSEVIAAGYDKLAAFRQHAVNFCHAARGREPLRADAQDALAAVDLVDAAYASLRAGGWRDVRPPLPLGGRG